MGFNIRKGGNFVICPPGTHIARCYMVVDLGDQNESYMGKKKATATPKIRIGFEFPELKHVFDEDRGLEPYTMSRKYTNSLGDKSALKPMLNAWRGRDLTELDIKGG